MANARQKWSICANEWEKKEAPRKKKFILRRCEWRDADGVCGNNGGDAFDTDSQHVYSVQIYYRKLIHLKVYYCSRGFFPISFYITIMVCTCEKGDAQNRD